MFITGQLPIRTGLTTVGMAGSPIGLSEKDPSLAEILKPLGYSTGQFGKTIWETGTNIYPQYMALMNFMATCII